MFFYSIKVELISRKQKSRLALDETGLNIRLKIIYPNATLLNAVTFSPPSTLFR